MSRLLSTLLSLASAGLLSLLLSMRLGTWVAGSWLDVLDTFALYVFLPFLGTAVFALALRSRLLAGLSVVALALFAHQFNVPLLSLASFSGSDAEAGKQTPTELRVLTLNGHAAYDETAPIIDLLGQQRPDLVVIQEVNTLLAEAVGRGISGDYPFSFAAGLNTEHGGSATWSRYPLEGGQEFRLGMSDNVLHRAQAIMPGGKIWIYNIHLSNPTGSDQGDSLLAGLWRFDSSQRDLELDALTEQIEQLDAPFILAGDFNLAVGSRAYRRFPAEWRDAFAEVGYGFGHTYPSPEHELGGEWWLRLPFPLLRIDYIVSSSELQPRQAWTHEVRGSDHYAVIADLRPKAR